MENGYKKERIAEESIVVTFIILFIIIVHLLFLVPFNKSRIVAELEIDGRVTHYYLEITYWGLKEEWYDIEFFEGEWTYLTPDGRRGHLYNYYNEWPF
jgi:hypothetical protein